MDGDSPVVDTPSAPVVGDGDGDGDGADGEVEANGTALDKEGEEEEAKDIEMRDVEEEPAVAGEDE